MEEETQNLKFPYEYLAQLLDEIKSISIQHKITPEEAAVALRYMAKGVLMFANDKLNNTEWEATATAKQV